ncbi:MAG: tripartite tricarboxylate transporter substrate-binding protein [Burkholderiaceae bacterium]
MSNPRSTVATAAAVSASLACALSGFAGPASAQQDYPSRPVSIIVPFAAGGPTDTVARVLAASMTKSLGGTLIVENKAGAGGTLGAAEVARAAPDGYKLLVHHIGMSTQPALYRKLSFDSVTSFQPIAMINDVPMTVLSKRDFPAKDLKELIAYAKKNPEKVTLANAGVGSASHLCGLMFMSAIDAPLVSVPYKGTAPAMTDLMGGQVDLLCDQTTNTTEQIRGEKVKAYAVTTAERLATLSNLPTTTEAGLPALQVGVWHAMYAPKGTPKPIVDKLVAAVQSALKDEALLRRFNDLGAIPYPVAQQTPEGVEKKLKTEIDRWTPIIRKAGIYAD